jgi:hypothetical protein
VIVEHIGNVIDIWDEATPNCCAIFRRHSKGYDAIKFRSQKIGVFVPAEEFFEDAFLVSVEYELFFANIPENLVV